MMTKCNKKSDVRTSGRAASAASTPMTVAPRVLIRSRALAEETGRAEEEDGDEDDENADPSEIFAEEKAAQRFRDADDETAQERAREASHAAQHDDGEGDDDEAFADPGMGIVAGEKQRGGGADAGDAEAEAHREGVLDVDADELGAAALECQRADRLAEIGALHQKPEQRGDNERARERHRFRHGDEGDAEIDGGEGVCGTDRARVATPEIEGEIID